MVAAGESTLRWKGGRSEAEATTGATPDVDLTALVETYAKLLFRVAHSIVRTRQEAEDVVQDTFVRVLEHRKALPEVRDLRPWLVRITWNLALDRQRKVRPDQMEDGFAETLLSSAVPADRVHEALCNMRVLLAAIDRLPKAERQALLLSAVEELATAEIAVVMGKSESATRALLFRARTRLKERMKGASA